MTTYAALCRIARDTEWAEWLPTVAQYMPQYTQDGTMPLVSLATSRLRRFVILETAVAYSVVPMKKLIEDLSPLVEQGAPEVTEGDVMNLLRQMQEDVQLICCLSHRTGTSMPTRRSNLGASHGQLLESLHHPQMVETTPLLDADDNPMDAMSIGRQIVQGMARAERLQSDLGSAMLQVDNWKGLLQHATTKGRIQGELSGHT